MKKSKWDKKIPTNPYNGNVPRHDTGTVYSNNEFVKTQKIDNFVFSDVIYNFKFSYKNNFVTADSIYNQQAVYNISFCDFEKMIPLLINGKLNADFTYCKRGEIFGMKLFNWSSSSITR
jgi:hypothetical protein